MTTPNIDMITASLRNCSLGRRRRREPSSSPPPPPSEFAQVSDESAQVSVELNSETALPSPWEQFLDMRTGEVYYINWETGVRGTEDPRGSSHAAQQTRSNSDEEADEEEEEEEEEEEKEEEEEEEEGEEEEEVDDEEEEDYSDEDNRSSNDASEDATGSTCFSSTSSPEPSTSSEYGGGQGQVLVAAGCKSCFTYFMVPKRVHACLRCGGRLLHLGRDSNNYI